MISISSVICALGIYTIVLFAECLVCTVATGFLKRGGTFILLLLSAVATLRLLLPFEIPITHLIRSWEFIGKPLYILRTYPFLVPLLLAVWIGGGIVVVYRDARSLYQAYKISSCYVRVEDARVQKMIARHSIPYPVVVSPHVSVPYVEGIFRHTIYFPALGLSEEDIEYALLHEVQHIRNHDSIIKFFFRLLVAVIWWNPIAHWFWRVLDDLLELHCDAKVIDGLDDEERRLYGNALRAVAQKAVKEKRVLSSLAVNGLLAIGRNEFIITRMEIILDGTHKPRRSVFLAAGCAVAAFFCVSYLVIIQPAGMPHEDKFEEKPGVTYHEEYVGPITGGEMGSIFIIKDTQGRYKLCIDYEFSRYLTEAEVASEQYKDIFIIEESKQK